MQTACPLPGDSVCLGSLPSDVSLQQSSEDSLSLSLSLTKTLAASKSLLPKALTSIRHASAVRIGGQPQASNIAMVLARHFTSADSMALVCRILGRIGKRHASNMPGNSQWCSVFLPVLGAVECR